MRELTSHPSYDSFNAALRDLHDRTLSRLQSNFARLVYLASTRNYNTGRYEHDGLNFHFTANVAERALAAAHQQVFMNLALGSLESLTDELRRYIDSETAVPEELLSAWNDLEAYRILVPARGDRLAVQIFRSNLRTALAIVAPSWNSSRPAHGPRGGSQLLSHGL